MITESLKQEFESRGIIQLKNVLSPKKVAQSKDLVMRHLEHVGIWKDGTWNLSDDKALTSDNAQKSFTQSLKKQSLFNDLLLDAQMLISELLDNQPTFPATDYPHPLVTFPNASSWSIPTKSWHLDCPRLSKGGIPGIQAFTFLEEVKQGGAGTLAVMGSHRLLNDQGFIRSSDVVKQLKQETYFSNLMSKDFNNRERYLNKSEFFGNIELKLIEMIGEPGDVYLMDLRVVHVAASNVLAIPRIMLTQRYLLEVALGEYRGKSTS